MHFHHIDMHKGNLAQSQMNWGAFDLNLLIVFDAIMEERNVTRAGRKVGLSQPAMSHALNRLRHLLNDDLFVRTPDGMVPTPRAEQLAVPLRTALTELRVALESESFDPRRSRRRFAIALHNYAATVVAPPLVVAAAEAAPSVRLDLRPGGTLRVTDLLDRDELDLAIGSFADLGERFASAPLLEDEFVLMMRPGHPIAEQALTPHLLAQQAYVVVSSDPLDTEFLDDLVREHGLTRDIAVHAPRLSVPGILLRSDLVVILSRRVGQSYAQIGGFRIRDLPCSSPRPPVGMVWHRRLDNDPAHRWLRELIQAVCRDL
jgi:DNA-binding transcriptional LysR family regulator